MKLPSTQVLQNCCANSYIIWYRLAQANPNLRQLALFGVKPLDEESQILSIRSLWPRVEHLTLMMSRDDLEPRQVASVVGRFASPHLRHLSISIEGARTPVRRMQVSEQDRKSVV